MENISGHESKAELLSPEDVDQDVVSLSEALEEKRAEQIAHHVLLRQDVRQILHQLMASGICSNEEDIIVRALRTLLAAVSPMPYENPNCFLEKEKKWAKKDK